MTEFKAREDARSKVVRSAAVWTPIFVVSTALSIAFAVLALDSPGAWISFAIAALIGVLSGVSALGALRDLYTEPVETQGLVERKWRKSDILVFRGHYILCRKRVFRVPREDYEEMPEAGGGIIIRHYPHTNALVAWSKTPEAPGEARGEAEEGGESEEVEQKRAWVPAEGSATDASVGLAEPRLPERPAPLRDEPETVEPPRFGTAAGEERDER